MAKLSSSIRVIMKMAIVIASPLLLAPVNAIAESIASVQQQLQQPASLKKVRIGLDDDGNAMIRLDKVSISFIYEAGNSSQESRTQLVNSFVRLDVACLGGLSVKLGIAF
jgi:hypothetical protein